ncbi:hypothetical protein COL27_30195, partial [Bacillus sp. AFS075960]
MDARRRVSVADAGRSRVRRADAHPSRRPLSRIAQHHQSAAPRGLECRRTIEAGELFMTGWNHARQARDARIDALAA